MDKALAVSLTKDLNHALEKGWREFPDDPDYALARDYFFELADSGFFERKFRGKIANPAHELAVKIMSKYVNQVFVRHGISLRDFYPGDFRTSTGTEISDDPDVPLYEHRNFHNQTSKDGGVLCDLTITICHIRGKFEFPKTPFVTLTEVIHIEL
ncbi:MAG TPA: hypothetical protein VH144_03125 [Candidatus Saccharimonadales bacterium]|jgi:hypothetical protein|nr:hypothetical protein [Candidatus Saccharimonadales bacterium]